MGGSPGFRRLGVQIEPIEKDDLVHAQDSWDEALLGRLATVLQNKDLIPNNVFEGLFQQSLLHN